MYYLKFTCRRYTIVQYTYTYYKQRTIVLNIHKNIYKSLKIYDSKNKQET